MINILRAYLKNPFISSVSKETVQVGKEYKYYPVVGIVMGAFLFLIGALTHLILSDNLKANESLGGVEVLTISTIIVLFEMVFTGGSQLEGLANTFNGIFRYRSKHRMLDTMQKDTLGINGVLAIVFTILLKIFFISILGIESVLFYSVIGRLIAVIAAAEGKNAFGSIKGRHLIKNTNKKEALLAFIISACYFGMLWPLKLEYLWYIAMVVMIFVGFIFNRVINHKIGGINGDTLGATVELAEVCSLLVMVFLTSIW